ncbi:MAG TPA: SGNH/GDSL hydrolase family protein [Pyrinomonadaceae bacterium]|jgi:Lysophospholipase L1 and related esterases|nr:SGNH/GDSL hydrolase family protein [Pyrinomonadaceae bacterium]
MSESAATTQDLPEQRPRTRIPLRRRLIYIALIYVVFLLLLFGIELLTRFTMAPVSSLDLFVSTPQQKMQVADPAQAGIFEGDPLLLWRLKPNLNQVVWDFTVLSTNSQHFRADYPIVEKPAGTFRVICLGDSVTFGYRVPTVWPDKPTEYDHESLPFPMLLEKHLHSVNPSRKIEVFPMAVPGYTSHQGFAWLQRDINRLQPDMVIASFGWNDASLSDVPDRDAIRTDFYPVAIRWLIDHSQVFAHATHWLRSRNPTSQGQVHPGSRVSQLEYLNNFSKIVNLVRSRGAVIVVVGAPYRDARTNPPEAELMKQYRAALRANMKEQKVPYLEVLELTEAASPANDGFFGELIHPNNMGHRLLASELLKLMEREKLLGELNVAGFEP